MEILKPTDAGQLLDAVRGALASDRRLDIVGRGTKRGYGRPVAADSVLDVSGIAGIVAYEPEELVVTVLAGTRLEELAAELASRRQCLAFEPADWGGLLREQGSATLGGVVAANIAGPRRVTHGAARDHVLGLKGVSGLGEAFVCGGRVVKNVTGFDLPKLLTGSLGTLAVLHEITLRVAPLPKTQATVLLRGLDEPRAVEAMTAGLASPCAVSGAAHLDNATALRLEGAAVSVAARVGLLSRLLEPFGVAEILDEGGSARLWQAVRDVRPFADDARLVWRLMVPPSRVAGALSAIRSRLPAEAILDRGGALAWLALEGDDPAEDVIRPAAEAAGGRATLFRAPAAVRRAVAPFHPEPPPLARLSARVKAAFDPKGILNPGRMGG